MYDLKLNEAGDLEVNDFGDVMLTQSVRQAVLIRLRWLFGEWRFAPEAGVPYIERIMVKKPDVEAIKQIIRQEIMDVDFMNDVNYLDVKIVIQTRTARITFDCYAYVELYREEVLMFA